MLALLLIAIALLCFAVVATGLSSRVNLISAGLFFWCLASSLTLIHP